MGTHIVSAFGGRGPIPPLCTGEAAMQIQIIIKGKTLSNPNGANFCGPTPAIKNHPCYTLIKKRTHWKRSARAYVCITILFNILPLDLLPQSSPFSYFLKTGRATLYCELYQPKENHVGLSTYRGS